MRHAPSPPKPGTSRSTIRPNQARVDDAPAPAPDRQLVEEFRRGSARAYDTIYQTYRGRVVRTCRKYLSDPADVEEAVQDTFARAYVALDRFNGQFRLGAWLARIATNVSIDRVRRNQRSTPTAPLETAPEPRDAAPGPEAIAEASALPDGVLESMRSTHVRALLLRAEGYSHAEIGRELGKSPAQAKALLHRARESFKHAWRTVGTGAAVLAFAVAGPVLLRLSKVASAAAPLAGRLQSGLASAADAAAPPLAALAAEAGVVVA